MSTPPLEPAAPLARPSAPARRVLPVVSSLRNDGSRNTPQPADVHGRFITARRVAFALLIALWIALPLVTIGGHPAVLIELPARRFYLFGATFNAQDFWMVFFLATGFAFTVAFTTALWGRIWCAWACPHTVFLEFLFRPIQRLIEGPREQRIRLAERAWDADKVLRRGALHLAYAVTAIGVAHVFLSYFLPWRTLIHVVRNSPAEHPEAFTWVAVTSVLMYGHFSWFREQLCLVVCPYGRLQSVLIDADSTVVGYDVTRGEPRGKSHDAGAGDCVDCNRCVAVCPTGIDIRNGIQLDCVGCTQCVDACDAVMDKLHRPRGLVRLDSLNGLAGAPRRVMRPRIAIYMVLMLVGSVVAFFALRTHRDFEANAMRLQGTAYVLDGAVVRNAFEVHVVNKLGSTQTFAVTVTLPAGHEGHVVLPIPAVTLGPLESARVPLFVEIPRANWRGSFPVSIRIARTQRPSDVITTQIPCLGPE